MSDNISVTPGSGAVIAAESVGGALIQRVKLALGDLDADTGDISAANPMPVIGSSAKNTQTTLALNTQDQKDTGRTAIILYATAAASGATGVETAITLSLSSGTSAVTTGTSFVVTSGKTLRITSIILASRGHATATAQITTFSLRMNTTGAVTTTSTPILLAAATATPATSSAWDRCAIDIPEGYEITGNGSIQIGLTADAVFTTNAPTWFATIVGYYY